ncbi:hypothetical protein J8273_0668 [Carpediemonas membranifera]|uniref:PH domain-containing protein n=1 Tax=Carpediemonas membranifera TaxID=201153 RepID=A0A8J6E4R8_9EUKA|nr:hypothetical protein J8273_0668 [Carpediemonas membranifera]|eukprot:KAG9397538.1 hypothetical protein J8273_0668 [Carpediemonas membranifera]
MLYRMETVRSVSIDTNNKFLFRILLHDNLPPKLFFAAYERTNILDTFMVHLAFIRQMRLYEKTSRTSDSHREMSTWRDENLPDDTITFDIEEVAGESYIPQKITFKSQTIITSSYHAAGPATRQFSIVDDVTYNPADNSTKIIYQSGEAYVCRISQAVRDLLHTTLVGRVKLHRYLMNRILAVDFPLGDHEVRLGPSNFLMMQGQLGPPTSLMSWRTNSLHDDSGAKTTATRPSAERQGPASHSSASTAAAGQGALTVERGEPTPQSRSPSLLPERDPIVETVARVIRSMSDASDSPPDYPPRRPVQDKTRGEVNGATLLLARDIRSRLEAGDFMRKCVSRREGKLHNRFFRLRPGGQGQGQLIMQWGQSKNDRNWKQLKVTAVEAGPYSSSEARTVTKNKATTALAFNITGRVVMLDKERKGSKEREGVVTLLAPDRAVLDKWVNGLQTLLAAEG